MVVEKNEYVLSVIMAIYNAENYLEEAIQSVVCQTIGFEDNIEIILINDGSTDASNIICERYKKRFPKNIQYFNQSNEGVSSARNKGIKAAKGRYIGFLDSDDKYGENTIENTVAFFEINYDQVDVVAMRIEFFDKMKGNHPLNYKFLDRISYIADLSKNYQAIQLSSSSTLIKKEAIIDHFFDERLKYGEDAKFIIELLTEKKKIGLISKKEACYWYRKRSDGGSAQDKNLQSENWYMNTLNNFHKYFVNGKNVDKFIQYSILYDLHWRIRIGREKMQILDDDEYIKYIDTLKEIILSIDYEIFENARRYFTEADVKNIMCIAKCDMQTPRIVPRVGLVANVNYINIIEGVLRLDITSSVPLGIHENIIMRLHDTIYYPVKKEPYFCKNLLGEKIGEKSFYSFELQLPENDGEIEYLIDTGDSYEIIEKIKYGKFSYLSNSFTNYIHDRDKLVRIYYNKLKYIFGKRRIAIFEFKRNLKMLMNKQTQKLGSIRCKNMFVKKNKKVLIFQDRQNKAGDNAEALMRKWKDISSNYEMYYIISKSSSDYSRLSKEGFNVVDYHSLEHKKLMLRADFLLYSHIDDKEILPFGKEYFSLRDLFKFKIIWLQHGITETNMNKWIEKSNKNLSLICASLDMEKEMFLDSTGYTNEEVVLTGLARFDSLEDRSEGLNYITLMPTWRPNLVNSKEFFLESEYYYYYYLLLNDIRLISTLRKFNRKIRFVQHPNFKKYNRYFYSNDVIEVISEADYSYEISHSKMLITDRSSIHFDFAYLNKPILYNHFDIQKIYENSIYEKGEFDYSEHGFGIVCHTIDEMVDNITQLIESDFRQPEKYEKRREEMFKYLDRNNCQRIIEAIEKL